MNGSIAAWWRRRDTYDVLAVLFIVACLVLILLNLAMYPVFLDIPYHMAVTEGFREAGGVTTWDYWDYAPEGRPHIYPPLLHVSMSLLEDIGLSSEATATFVCLIMFPLILLSLWWAMRKLFGSRAALYAVILTAISYAFFWQTGVTIAASLVLALTPLVFLFLEQDRKAAAAVLLAMCLYSHLVLGHLVALALFIYMIHRREAWKKILTVLVAAYLLYLPWGIVVLSNLSSFSVSQPGMGGGFTLHILLWGLAAAGFVVCYLRKKQYYLLPSYLLSMVPIAFFYSQRFWDGHIFVPLAMLGAVALDRLHAFVKERLSRRSPSASHAGAVAAVVLGVLLVMVLTLDPVLASSQGGPTIGAMPGITSSDTGVAGLGDALPQAVYGNAPSLPRVRDRLQTLYGEVSPPLADVPPASRLQGEGGAVQQLQRLRAAGESSVDLSLRPTTLLVLLGLQDPQERRMGDTEVFSQENQELMEAIEEYSEPGDVVFTTDGRLGDLIYAMTGRYSMQGMFHEVQPEEQPDPLEDADLAVVQASLGSQAAAVDANRFGGILGEGEWSEVGRAGNYIILANEAGGGSGGETSDAALPLWAAYALLAAALLVIIIDLVRGRLRYRPGGGAPLPPPPDAAPGRGGAGGDSVLAVIPAYNEEGNVGGVVSEIRRTCPGLDVLVVDDGSSDATGAEALEAGGMVLRLDENLGIGEAERRGLAYALDHGYGYVVRLDGDGQHPASYIPDLLVPLRRGYADAVVGSRFLAGRGDAGDASRPRRLGMAYFRAMLRIGTSRRYSDPTSGFRAYSRRAMRLISRSETPRYPEVTSLRLLSLAGLEVSEVEVEMRARLRGRSSLSAWNALIMMISVTTSLLRPPLQASSSPAGTSALNWAYPAMTGSNARILRENAYRRASIPMHFE